ncbi:MAG: hypothetical protein J7K30_10690 [Deltaproteobacteria bacterium]|nr:hypothetical protein [Deltaproteobacteria bacterium]
MFLIKCAAVLIAALLIGKWFSTERNKILAQGDPWSDSWKTIPGILILVILCILIFIKIAFDL